jgi:ubiquinone/menaquinone biosynthesis C-methylase UbiE
LEQRPNQPVSIDTETFKRRDAQTHNGLPPTYTEYVYRLSYFIVEELCQKANLKDGDIVLDVGSGTGMATAAAAELVAPTGHVTGIDHSRVLVEEARAGAPLGLGVESLPLDYQVMDAENLELKDASFDVVISFSAVMHFPNPEKALAEMYRVTKPGGRLVVTYTGIHPAAYIPRLRIRLAQMSRKLPFLLHPQLHAPQAVAEIADEYLPRLDQPAEPGWFKREGGKRVRAAVTQAGFVDMQKSWIGRNIVFNSPEEYFEAQMMIDSDLRTRASLATEEQKEKLRRRFLADARKVLNAGGSLVYPFGAVIITARKPAA